MSRPKKIIRTVQRNISIPEDLNARLELELFSEIEGKIPFGAMQEFFTALLRAHFAMPLPSTVSIPTEPMV